jgi:hypothetical protein
LFFYNGDAADIQRLDKFTEIFLDSIKASANAMLPDDGQRIWRLRRLLELSLQVEPTETNSQSYALVRQMVKLSPVLLKFLCSDSLYYIPQPSLLKRYSDAEKISFPGLARKYLQQDERRKQTPSPLGQQMIGLLIELLKTNYRLLSGFVQQVRIHACHQSLTILSNLWG